MNESGNMKIKEIQNDGQQKWQKNTWQFQERVSISLDINADQTKCSSEKVYSWLDNNAYKYGFIKRYPSSKSYITGINNEPWHYRYVGKEAATIKNQNLCLEEYLKKYK